MTALQILLHRGHATVRTAVPYSQAQLIHWLDTQTGGNGTMTGQIESYKAPLENRVYYNYPGQNYGGSNPQPTYVVGTSAQATDAIRVIDNGARQVTSQVNASYNSMAISKA